MSEKFKFTSKVIAKWCQICSLVTTFSRGVMLFLDTLNILILRQLYHGETFYHFGPELKIPFKVLAKKFGVSEETVRNRIGKMFYLYI